MNIGDNGNLRRNIRLYTEVFLRFINDTVPKNYANVKVALFCIYFYIFLQKIYMYILQ